MSFEEEFPSLKGKRISVTDGYDSMTGDTIFYEEDEEGEFFYVDDVFETCIDKQKVKKAILKEISVCIDCGQDTRGLKRLLQRLGL